jgi:hypothetical protein
MIGIFPAVWTSTSYFSNSTGSSVTNCEFSPIIDKYYVFIGTYVPVDSIEHIRWWTWEEIYGIYSRN